MTRHFIKLNLDMIELFENKITGERKSMYRTNHFHMIVDGDIQVPNVGDMDDKNFGTLIHEYVHYIQHITTLFGIRSCNIFHKFSIMYRAYIDGHDTIKLPLNILDNNKAYVKYQNHMRNICGDVSCGHNVDAVDVLKEDIESARANHTAVNIGCYDFENNRIYEEGFRFGYLCVIESMAHIIQTLFTESVYHSPVPYCAAELIIREIYPEIINDRKLIASICFCALYWDNPSVGFFDVVKIAKANPEWNGIELFSHIGKDYAIKYNNVSMHRYLLVLDFLNEFKSTLTNLLGTQLDYYSLVIDNCIKEAKNSTSLLLNILYNVPLNDKQRVFGLLANYYGYPIIEANNIVILPNKSIVADTPKPYLETAVLFGWELLYTRFTESKGQKACAHLSVCQKGIYSNPSQCTVTEECASEPWLKKEDCPFTQCMRYFRFENKVFKED